MGFFAKLLLEPSPGDMSERLYLLLRANPAIWNDVLALVQSYSPSTPVSLSAALNVLAALYDHGLLWPVLKIGFPSSGWLPLSFALQTIGVLAHNPDVASTFSTLSVWIGQLNGVLSECPEGCSQG